MCVWTRKFVLPVTALIRSLILLALLASGFRIGQKEGAGDGKFSITMEDCREVDVALYPEILLTTELKIMSHPSPETTTSIDPEKYMTRRVEHKISLYQRLSKQQKYRYHAVAAVTIMLAPLVPVTVNLFKEQTLVPTILSLALTILVGLEKLFLFREHWKNYDAAEESLRREKYLFQARSGVYEGRRNDKGVFEPLDSDEAFRLFVQRFEDRIHEEREETIEARTQPLGGPNA